MKRSSSLFALIALLIGGVAESQESPSVARGAIRPFVGANIPTGDQRDFLEDAVLVGAQASWIATPNISVTGSFSWAPSKDRISAGDQTLDIYQYDLGVEARSAPTTFGTLVPFIGAGVGGRSYNYRDLDVESKTNFAGYGALGVDVPLGGVSLRFEGRDYVSRFQPFAGGETKTRNDVALFAAVGVSF